VIHGSTARAAALLAFAATIHPLAALAQGPAPLPAKRGVELSGRVQEVYSTASVDSLPDGEWSLRRVRLSARFRLNRFISGRVQPDYSGGEFAFKDAYLQFEAGPALRVLVGQSHRPFNPVARANEARVPMVEKTAKIRGVKARDAEDLVTSLGYANRDTGVQLLGALPVPHFPLQYELAAVRGPLDTSAPGLHPFQLGARLSATVAPELRVGAAWSRRDFAPTTGGAAGEIRPGSAYVADAEYGNYNGGPHLIAEAMTGEMDPFLDRHFDALQGFASYRFNPRRRFLSGVEPGLRASSSRVVGGAGEGGVLVTPAVSAYLRGDSRVTLNYSVWRPQSRAAEQHDWKVLFQMAF
jgi:hypothetical protein